MSNLEFAPELKFVKEISGVNYYHFGFAFHQMGPFFPAIQFGVTVAQSGDFFAANIRDINGLDYSTTQFSKEEFPGKWGQFINRLKSL